MKYNFSNDDIIDKIEPAKLPSSYDIYGWDILPDEEDGRLIFCPGEFYYRSKISSNDTYVGEQYSLLLHDVESHSIEIENFFPLVLSFLKYLKSEPDNDELNKYFVDHYEIQPVIYTKDKYLDFIVNGYTNNKKYNFRLFFSINWFDPDKDSHIYPGLPLGEYVNADDVIEYVSDLIHDVIPTASILKTKYKRNM